MERTVDYEIDDEPTILPFRAYQRQDPPPDDDQPDNPDKDRHSRIEMFWAGRNHAMRHSARWAA